MIPPDDGRLFHHAAYRAAQNLRHGGDDGAGIDLAERILSDVPLSPIERELLAQLVTDRLLPERRRARPAGDMHRSTVQMAAAREYLILTKRHGRASGKVIAGRICDRLGVKGRTLAGWVSTYRRNVQELNALFDRDPQSARDPMLQAGGRPMRQTVRLNSK